MSYKQMRKLQVVSSVSLVIMFALTLQAHAASPGYKGVIIVHEGPSYKVKVKYPAITDTRYGPDVLRKANLKIKTFAHKLYEDDLKAFQSAEWTKEELKKIAIMDTVDVVFSLVRMDDGIISVKFEKYYYVIGTVHGLTSIVGFNYDVRDGRVLTLKDMFMPHSNYLIQLAKYSVPELERQLERQGDSWILCGAWPHPRNYEEFNINYDGIDFYFQAYQVACYADGDSVVKIPFNKLPSLKMYWWRGMGN